MCCTVCCTVCCAVCYIVWCTVCCILWSTVCCILRCTVCCILWCTVCCTPWCTVCRALCWQCMCTVVVLCAVRCTLCCWCTVRCSLCPCTRPCLTCLPCLPCGEGGGGGSGPQWGRGRLPPCVSRAAEMLQKTSCSPRAAVPCGEGGGCHLSLPGAAGSLCAHVGIRAPRRGRVRAPTGAAAAVLASGRAVRASPAPAALRTPVWPAPAMPRARLPPLGGPPVPALAGLVPVAAGGARVPAPCVPRSPRGSTG